MLARIRGRIVHRQLDRISPLALPAMLQIGRERVASEEGEEQVLREAADELIREAMGE
jgi:ATP-dependent Lhr-like helicase